MTKKLFGYFFTAGTAALCDLSVFSLLFGSGASVLPAAIAGWLVAAGVNYVLTSRYVFRQALRLASGVRFLIGASAGFGLNVCLTILLTRYADLYPPLAKLFGIGGAFFANFLINLLWVFGRPVPAMERT